METKRPEAESKSLVFVSAAWMKKDIVVGNVKKIEECIGASKVRHMVGDGGGKDIAIVLATKSEAHLEQVVNKIKGLDGVKDVISVLKRL